MQAGGGFELFKEAFDGPTLPLLLSGGAGNGSNVATPPAFDLYSETGDVLLTHEGDGYDTYDATRFYPGGVPPGPAGGNGWAR